MKTNVTICNETGKAIYQTTEGVNHPVDYSFESINDFVHSENVTFEELQCCCLGMATEIDKLKMLLYSAHQRIRDLYDPAPLGKEFEQVLFDNLDDLYVQD